MNISRDTYDRKLEIHIFALKYPQFQRFWNLACHVFRGVRRSLKTTLPCLLPFVPCTVVILWQQPKRHALLFVEIPQNDQQHLHEVWCPSKNVSHLMIPCLNSSKTTNPNIWKKKRVPFNDLLVYFLDNLPHQPAPWSPLFHVLHLEDSGSLWYKARLAWEHLVVAARRAGWKHTCPTGCCWESFWGDFRYPKWYRRDCHHLGYTVGLKFMVNVDQYSIPPEKYSSNWKSFPK